MALEWKVDKRAEAALALLVWYDRHRRDLPWRSMPGERTDAYKVWLSEIMLQQTTVAAVKPYFIAFLSRWPSVGHLAQARFEEVMQQWAGLGYYSRARNLHACAKTIAGQFACNFPDTEAALRHLPGIGPYTAAAIAAIAFGRRAAAVDGNVERVIARLFAIKTPLPAAKSEIKAKAADLVPFDRPGDFAQAMMDLGATICSPKAPSCGICPLQKYCLGHGSGDAGKLPRKEQRRKRPLRHGFVFFIRRLDGAALVRIRPPKGLLGGMAEIPGTAWEPDLDRSLALKEVPVTANYRKLDHEVAHAFTHFALRLEIYLADVPNNQVAPAGCRFVPALDLDQEAFPSVMRKVIAAVRLDDARKLRAKEAPNVRCPEERRGTDMLKR